MATKIWRGTATSTPQVDKIAPSDLNPGDTITVTCNRKDLAITVRDDVTDQETLIADACTKIAAAIGQYNNATEAEFAELSAAVFNNAAGNAEYVLVTGPTDGKPFTLTSSASASDIDVLVQSTRTGVAAVTAKQRLVPRGTATGGTFDIVYDGTTISTIAYNASAATVQTAINTNKATYSPTVTVTGDAGGPYTIETTDEVPLITVDGSSLTGGDGVEVIRGQDGAEARTVISLTAAATPTADEQFRVTFGLDPSDVKVTPWINGDADEAEIANAFLAAGYFVSVERSTTATWQVELVSNLKGVAAANVQASVESTNDNWTVAVGSLSAVNEVTYLLINATSGNLTVGATSVDIAGANFTASSGTAGSLAKAILDETGLANTVTQMGSSTVESQDYIKIEYTGGVEVPTLNITDGTLAGGIFDTAKLTAGRPGVNAVQDLRFFRDASGGTFTVTYNGNTSSAIAYDATSGELETGLETITGISAGDVSARGPEGGPWSVEFTGNLAAQDVELMSGSGASLTGGNTPAATKSSVTTAVGPHNWDVDDNWFNPAAPSTPAAPTASDDVIFQDSDVDCLYNLDDLSGSTLSSLKVFASYTGKIGLPRYTGDYYEYRTRRVTCGITTLQIGQGQGNGSSRLKFNLGSATSTVTVFKTGTATEGEKAVEVVGTGASNKYFCLLGSVGIGTGEPGDSPAGTELIIGDGTSGPGQTNVTLAAGTITTIEANGGTADIRGSATTLNTHRGTITVDGSGTFTTLRAGGAVNYRSTGTITNLSVPGGGSFDLRQNGDGCTITNAKLYAGFSFFDPYGRGTYTNNIDFVECGYQDGTFDGGRNITSSTTIDVGVGL